MWIRGGLEIDFALASGREARSLLPYPQWSRATLPGAPAPGTAKSGEKVEAVTERQALPCVR